MAVTAIDSRRASCGECGLARPTGHLWALWRLYLASYQSSDGSNRVQWVSKRYGSSSFAWMSFPCGYRSRDPWSWQVAWGHWSSYLASRRQVLVTMVLVLGYLSLAYRFNAIKLAAHMVTVIAFWQRVEVLKAPTIAAEIFMLDYDHSFR